MARDLVDINTSGELNDIKLGGIQEANTVVIQAAMESYVAQEIANIPGGSGLTNPVEDIQYDPLDNGNAQYVKGRLWYDNQRGALSLQDAEQDAQLKIGQTTRIWVYNNTGETIPTGYVCKYLGIEGGLTPTVALAQADTEANAQVLGVAVYDIENNSYGYVTVNGVTAHYWGVWQGQQLYLSDTAPGEYTNVAPTIKVPIGRRLTDYTMLVDIHNIIP